MTTENESELDDRQLSALYKKSQQDMPPAHLDQTILSAAKKPLAATPINPFSHNWRIPVSLAAVLVLTVGIVTIMDDVNLSPVNGEPPLFIESDDALEQSLSSIGEEIQATQGIQNRSKPALKKHSEPMASAPVTIAAKADFSNSRRKLLNKQKRKKEVSLTQSKRAFSRLKTLSTDRPKLNSIKTLRLAGNTPLANKKADKFIRYYFGNELTKANPDQVNLSIKEWKEIISELRKLDRESIAIKLENLLTKRLEN